MALRKSLKLVLPSHNAVTIVGDGLEKLKNKNVKSETVIFDNCGDIQPFKGQPTFSNIEKVVIDDCHQKFPYYWLRKDNFPKLQFVLFNSHPSEPIVLQRFCSKHPKHQVPMFISDRFKKYYEKWGWFMGKRMTNLIVVPDDEMRDVIENFKN
jgi:hypothetical protein